MSRAPISSLCLALLIGTLAAPLRGETGSPLEILEREVQSVYDKSRDAVVKVHAQRQYPFGETALLPNHRVGTGFFINSEGLLLTAATVVADADTCWIEWRSQKFTTRLLGRCRRSNVAVLKLDDQKTPALPFSNVDDLRIGSMAIALGFAYDLPSSPVVGFVNGLDIRHSGILFPTSHIRASCKLSPGQGGGPLLNARGEVVGIVVAAHMDDQCYALPIAAARRVCADIIARGAPQHGWVGLEVTEKQVLLTNQAAATVANVTQIFVQQVISNTPAAAAGFQDRDMIVRIGTNAVTGLADVLDRMFQHHSGDQVNFAVNRAGTEQNITLTIGERPTEATVASQPPRRVPIQLPVSQEP